MEPIQHHDRQHTAFWNASVLPPPLSQYDIRDLLTHNVLSRCPQRPRALPWRQPLRQKLISYVGVRPHFAEKQQLHRPVAVFNHPVRGGPFWVLDTAGAVAVATAGIERGSGV